MTGASAGATCPFSPGHGGEAGCADVGGLGSPWRPLSIWSGLPGLEGSMGGVAVSGLASHHGLRVVSVGRSRKEKGRKRLLVPWSPAELFPRETEVRRPAWSGRALSSGPEATVSLLLGT